jgi:hypothetical protein
MQMEDAMVLNHPPTLAERIENLHACVEDMLSHGQLALAEQFCEDAFNSLADCAPDDAGPFADDAEQIAALRDGTYDQLLKPQPRFTILW